MNLPEIVLPVFTTSARRSIDAEIGENFPPFTRRGLGRCDRSLVNFARKPKVMVFGNCESRIPFALR